MEQQRTDSSNLFVIFVKDVGVDSDGNNVYEFLLSEKPDDVYQEQWNEKPACNENNLQPDDNEYDYIKELRTDIKFDLGQDNCCCSFGDIKDHVACLVSENIDEYEEYPEPCRIVIQYGDSLEDVERLLAQRDLYMKYI